MGSPNEQSHIARPYRLSYRDLVEMMAERGVVISYSTILRLCGWRT
jgi:transposase-like protein